MERTDSGGRERGVPPRTSGTDLFRKPDSTALNPVGQGAMRVRKGAETVSFWQLTDTKYVKSPTLLS